MKTKMLSDYIEKATTELKTRGVSPLTCNIERTNFIEVLLDCYKYELRGNKFDERAARELCTMLVDAINTPREQTLAIMIGGNVGTGKTTLLLALRDTLRLAIKDGLIVPTPSPIIAADNIVNSTPNKDYVTLLDDIGTEAAEIVEYGNIYRPFTEWVEACYKFKYPFIFTTNLNSKSIGERYGDRVYDRLKEMCAIVTAKGESYRGK